MMLHSEFNPTTLRFITISDNWFPDTPWIIFPHLFYGLSEPIMSSDIMVLGFLMYVTLSFNSLGKHILLPRIYDNSSYE